MRIPLSHRVPHAPASNTLSIRLAELRARGTPIVDLTASNPTAVGIPYPEGLFDGLAARAVRQYEPAPFGLQTAREAVAADCARRGVRVDPGRVVLTASTSEAYTWLFKLFCDPGSRVLVPRPSYPLFEHLARLEGVELSTYDLAFHGRWDLDLGAIAAGGPDVRALVLVSPNNPTGSCVSPAEAAAVAAICRDRGWGLIVDEVFADYPLDAGTVPSGLWAGSPCLTVSLGGLSKSVGLPQVKVGWMIVNGPDEDCRRVMSGLEIVADAFLSVSTPAQAALPGMLSAGAVVRDRIHARLRTNLSVLKALAKGVAGCDVPPVEGGWSAVVRVPAVRSEESLVLELLERAHVLVYPGYFFDFRHEAYLVVSLLVDPVTFARALPIVLRGVAGEQALN